MVEKQPLGPEAIPANAIKTPGMIPKEIIANNDVENENEKKKAMETEEKKRIKDMETEAKEKELREKLLREICENSLKIWNKKPAIEQDDTSN